MPVNTISTNKRAQLISCVKALLFNCRILQELLNKDDSTAWKSETKSGKVSKTAKLWIFVSLFDMALSRPVSRWTKRRRIKTELSHLLNEIQTNDIKDECNNLDETPFACVHESQIITSNSLPVACSDNVTNSHLYCADEPDNFFFLSSILLSFFSSHSEYFVSTCSCVITPFATPFWRWLRSRTPL